MYVAWGDGAVDRGGVRVGGIKEDTYFVSAGFLIRYCARTHARSAQRLMCVYECIYYVHASWFAHNVFALTNIILEIEINHLFGKKIRYNL